MPKSNFFPMPTVISWDLDNRRSLQFKILIASSQKLFNYYTVVMHSSFERVLLLNKEPLRDLLNDDIELSWNNERKSLFKIMSFITEVVSVVTRHHNPFFITVSAFLKGIGFLIIQMIENRKLAVMINTLCTYVWII